MSAAMNKKQFLLTQHACPEGLSQDVFDAIREFCWIVALDDTQRAEANLTSFLHDFEVYDGMAQEHSIYYGFKNTPAFFTATKEAEIGMCVQEIYERFLQLGIPDLDDFKERFFQEEPWLIDDFRESEYIVLEVAEALQEYLYGFEYQHEKNQEAQQYSQSDVHIDEHADEDDEESRELELCFWVNADGLVSYFLIKEPDHDRLKVLIQQMGCGKGSQQMVTSSDSFPSL